MGLATKELAPVLGHDLIAKGLDRLRVVLVCLD